MNNNDKRSYERHPIRTKVTMTIMRPNETFTPTVVAGIATDISPLGIRVKTPLLTAEDCVGLMKGPRFAKLELDVPGMPAPLKFKVDIFWAKFYDESHNERAYAELGFSFRDLSKDEVFLIERLLERLEK